jgi:urea carboxylase/allophanate hydrolase
MCIYATDSPGGYQLVGRTIEIWDSDLVHSGNAAAWFFRRFDRISFYPVSEAVLDHTPTSELVQICDDGVLDLEQYEAWLEENKEDISKQVSRQEKAIAEASFVGELCRPYEVESHTNADSLGVDVNSSGLSGERVKATMPGRCYKVIVKEGSDVEKGDILVSPRCWLGDGSD